MDQCSPARHPTSTTGPLTKPPGHDLVIGPQTKGPGIYEVLTDSRLGQQHARRPAIAVPLGIMTINHLPSPHIVRRKDRIDRRAGPIITVRPQVGVGIERL